MFAPKFGDTDVNTTIVALLDDQGTPANLLQ
jgi:hypothetical protein